MPPALFTKLVATASPFANTTGAGSITEAADVRSWLFLLVSSMESEQTQLVPPRSTQPSTSNSNAANTGSGAAVAEDDPSAEPSPQTAGNAIAPWQDDRSGRDDQIGTIEGYRVENAAGKLPPSTTANTTPAPSHASADTKSREVALPQINRLSVSNSKKSARAANSSGHAPSTQHAPSSQPLQHTRTSKHSDAAGRRGGGRSPSGGASNNNSLQMREDDAPYNSTMDSTGGGGRSTPHSSSYVLSKRAIAAQKSRDATLHEKEFWANRLRLLRREMEQVEQSVAAANENALRQGAAQVEDAIRQQLQDEQAREMKTRAERLEANRIQREAHNRSVREAQQASLAAKRSLCQARRKESVEATVFVEEQHSRELHRRSLLKEAVQQEKVVQVLVRARTRALKMEETRRLYEQHIQLLQDEDEQLQQATASLIQESSRYVQKMRLLKEERSAL
jgi:hypothetical protein